VKGVVARTRDTDAHAREREGSKESAVEVERGRRKLVRVI